MIIRQLTRNDHEAFKRLFEEAYTEYLESLRLTNPKQYQKKNKKNEK